jgi:hypothetical protein
VSVDTTIAAWQTWLAAQSSPLNTQTYKHAPPWPYTGTYPYVIILPRDQPNTRYSDASVYWSGWWRLIYVDLVGSTYTSVDQLLEAAGTWAETLKSTLQASAPNRHLNNGTVDYVAEGPDGSTVGLIVRWDEKQTGLDTNETPYWALPVDVFVREVPVSG